MKRKVRKKTKVRKHLRRTKKGLTTVRSHWRHYLGVVEKKEKKSPREKILEKLAKNGWKIKYASDNLIELENGPYTVEVDKDYVLAYIDSRKIIEDYMAKNEKLSKQLASDFNREYDPYEHGLWQEYIKEWIKKRGWKPLFSGNTYNDGDWPGSVFEYTVFSTNPNAEDIEDADGIVIMWHLGGDVRGNYDDPEIWFGDVYGFIYDAHDFLHPGNLVSEEDVEHALSYIGLDYKLIKKLQKTLK